MAIFSSTITDLVANKSAQPYYRFDGIDDYIDITLTGGIAKNSSGTINMWYYGTDHSGIVFALHGASDTYRYFNFHPYSGANRIGVVDDVGSWQYVTIAENLIDKWSMITMVVNKATTGGTYSIYVNGVAKFTDESFTGNFPTEPTRLRLGDYISGSYPAKFSTSNVSLYNIALSSAEVEGLYSGESVPYKYKGAGGAVSMNNAYFQAGDGATWNTDSGTWALSTTRAYRGTHSVKAYGGTNTYFRKAETINTTIGKRYRASCWVWQSSSDANNGRLNVGTSSNGTQYGQGARSETESWVYVYQNFTATQSTVYLSFKGDNSPSEVYYDDLQLVRIGAIAEYDGSGISSDKWFDKSGTDYHSATVVGATVENAPSGDSGLVYEEGSWTPTNNGTGWSHSQGDTNTYVRVGKMVTLYVYLQLSSGSSTQMDIAGLPFVSASNNYTSSTEMNHGTNAGQYSAHYRLYGGASIMYLHRTDTGAELDADTFNGTHQVFSITYKCA